MSDESPKEDKNVEREVSNLFNLKKKMISTNDLHHAMKDLKKKYNDDKIVEKIQNVFISRYNNIVKTAKSFADAVKKRYGGNIPYHILLQKSRLHAEKHNIDEDEFAEFQKIYEQNLAGTEQKNEVLIQMSNIMKVLGNVTPEFNSHFEINEDDFHNLQEIIKLCEVSKPLYAQTMLQTLQYEDLALQAINVIINKNIHNPNDHIHPVLAAMFLPKIHMFETFFIYANIANIVKSRYNKEPLTTRPDYELFYNLVTDPNDIVCDYRSPVGDLLNRCNLQNHIWNSIIHLRNGQLFNPAFRDFTNAIDICRLNKYDTTDLVYGKHDGTIIKRIFAAFSFRPTVVVTMPITNVFATNPYAQNNRPTVTSIPMVNIKLHAYTKLNPLDVGYQPVKLSKCLKQPQTFIEKNIMVQYLTDVVYSREVIIFYIDRRANILQYNTPFSLSSLPTAVAGFEKINTYPIDIECKITLNPSIENPVEYCLRSVVVADILNSDNTNKQNMVIGSSTFLCDYKVDSVTGKKGCNGLPTILIGSGNYDIPDQLFHYDPINAIKNGMQAIYDTNSGVGVSTAEAMSRISKQGIIFIYQNFNYKTLENQDIIL
jgi:hypothetical protein